LVIDTCSALSASAKSGEEPQDAPWSRMGGNREWRLVVGSLRQAPRVLDIGPAMRPLGTCIRQFFTKSWREERKQFSPPMNAD
jgi:hypothetical protein